MSWKWSKDCCIRYRNLSFYFVKWADTRTFIGFVGYYFYHPIEQKMFVSKYTFLEKEFVLERRCERKIEINELQEPQIDIQMEQKLEAITFDVHPKTQETQEHCSSGMIRHAKLRYQLFCES
jgi:hypothetical protein